MTQDGRSRALTPLFGNGAGAFRIGKNSVVLIKIGKKYKVYALKFLSLDCRALTPLFGNGAGAFRIGKNSVVLIKIGKKYKVYALKFLSLD